MEGSKAFSKEFMDRHSIPTAKYRVFSSSEVDQAILYVKTCGHKVVLKASGLAGGKGVLIPDTVEEAISGLQKIMVANAFGAAGPRYPPCNYILSVLNPIIHFYQETRLSLKSCLPAQKSRFWLSLMVIPSSHYLPLKIINESVKVMLG